MKLKGIFGTIAACITLALSTLSVNAAEGLPTKAFISGEIGAFSVYNVDNITPGSISAEITGDAQYEVEWRVTDKGTDELTVLALSIPNITADSFADVKVNITSVYVDGLLVSDYKMSDNAINTAYYHPGRDPETRVYLYDEKDGTNVADLPKNTAIKESIRVVFTITGTGEYGTSNIPENTIASTENPEDTSSQGTSDTTITDAVLDSSTTGDAGVALAAAAGLVITAGIAILSKVKFKKK